MQELATSLGVFVPQNSLYVLIKIYMSSLGYETTLGVRKIAVEAP